MGFVPLSSLLVCTLLGGFSSQDALAHSGSSAYIHLEETEGNNSTRSYQAHVQFKLEDLHDIIWLDGDNNGEITWREVRARKAELQAFARESLSMRAGELDCEKSAPAAGVTSGYDGLAIEEIAGQHYADLLVTFQCGGGDPELVYSGLLRYNARHRAFLSAFAGTVHYIFSVDEPSFLVRTDRNPLNMRSFRQFLSDGMFHVFTGYDHVLFLVLLLLPSVVVRREKSWQPEPSLHHCSIEVLKIVTAFTFAHSLTMGLSVFQVVNIASGIIEPVIAVSILIAAINNLWPYARTSWVIAGLFGLIHGFGFASLLRDTGIGGPHVWFILGAFNIGIELAQAMLVLLLMPVLWHLRRFRFYSSGVLAAGSCCAAVAAIIWTVVRVF